MKVYELFEGQIKINFAKMQQEIYAAILAKIKTDTGTKAIIKNDMENDRFWTDTFDDAHESFEDYTSGDDFSNIYDSLGIAVEAVIENIDEHFSNKWNHEPGYKKPKLTLPKESGIDLDKLIAKISPEIVMLQKSHKKEMKKAETSQNKNDAKSIDLEALAKFVNENDANVWEEILILGSDNAESIEKDKEKKKNPMRWFEIGDIISYEAFKKIKTSKQLKDYAKKNKSAKQYIAILFDNFDYTFQNKARYKKYLNDLFIVSKNDKACKELIAKLK